MRGVGPFGYQNGNILGDFALWESYHMIATPERTAMALGIHDL